MDALSRLTVIFLLNALWQIALVTAIATLLDRWLRGAPARYRHLLWMMAVAAVIALPLASSRSTPDAAAPAVTSAAAGQELWPVPLPAARAARVSRAAAARAFLRRAMAGAHPAIRIPRTAARSVFVFYVAFLIVMAVRFARAWLRTREIRQHAAALPSQAHPLSPLAPCHSSLDRCLAAADRAGASILWSSGIPGPVTVGARRPTIILPLRLLDPAAEDDLKAALAHELAHVRRHDYLGNLICELLLVPLVFHPLALIVKRRLSELRELASDELAASTLNPAGYARSLVRMAHQISDLALPAAPGPDYTLGVFDADILEERVMRLLKPRASMRLAKSSLFCAALCIAASCVAAAAFSMAPAQGNQTGEANQIGSAPAGSVTGAVKAGVPGGVVGGVVAGVPGGVVGGVPTARTSKYAGKDYSDAEKGSEANTGALTVPHGQESADQQRQLSGGEVSPYDRWVNEEVPYIITPEERAAFQKLATNAERDEFIAQFWERRNPNPGSSTNVFKEEYYRRIAYANDHFKSSVRPGWKTDRGHMYILYGPPDEIDAHDASKPHPFEVWRYNHVEGVGDGVSFMFVDQYGNGDFGLTAAPWNWPNEDKTSGAGPRKVRVGGAVMAAKLIKDTRVSPEYPQEAKDKRIEGLVVLRATISAEGVPISLNVVSSPDDTLSQAAIDAVRQWRYQPTLLNGEPVEVLTEIDVNFRLQN